MADETPAAPAPEPSRAQERITELSEKVRQEAEARAAAEAKATEALKKATFAEGFVDMVGTYPAAKNFKADIESKVMAGYSVEDATLAVLGKAGQLGAPAPAPAQAPEMPAGGSASTAMPQGGDKPISEMTQSERRAQLEKDLLFQ